LLTFAREIAQLPEEMIAAYRSMPEWQAAIDSADTLIYEVKAVRDYSFDPERFRDLMTPTLLLMGTESPTYMQVATGAVAASLPNVQLATFEGQGHLAMDTAPELFVGSVMQFLAG
jgi:pimeloyl-ACP methyl ester carboxylesterase